jgi:hypothetical protein
MIEKQDFYHGATLVRLLEDSRCSGIIKSDIGYTVNTNSELYPKYTTKSRSPWTFTFKQGEINKLKQLNRDVVIAFICAGDGICAITLDELKIIYSGLVCCITIRRDFRQQYSVSGPSGEIHEKIHFNRINALVFGENKQGRII